MPHASHLAPLESPPPSEACTTACFQSVPLSLATAVAAASTVEKRTSAWPALALDTACTAGARIGPARASSSWRASSTSEPAGRFCAQRSTCALVRGVPCADASPSHAQDERAGPQSRARKRPSCVDVRLEREPACAWPVSVRAAPPLVCVGARPTTAWWRPGANRSRQEQRSRPSHLHQHHRARRLVQWPFLRCWEAAESTTDERHHRGHDLDSVKTADCHAALEQLMTKWPDEAAPSLGAESLSASTGALLLCQPWILAS